MKRWLVCSTLSVSTLVLLLSSQIVGQVAVTTYHNDNYRSGVNAHETILTPSNVNEVTFGKRFALPVSGYIYGQPLYVPQVNINGTLHNVVYVVTEHDQAYAFDVNSGQLLWNKNFLISTNPFKTILPIDGGDTGCVINGYELGISSTPVIDLTTNEIYIVAATKEIVNGNTTFYQRMHVLDIGTGVEKSLGPAYGAPIKAKVPGTGAGSVDGYISFDPKQELQRTALTLANGQVYVAWAALCDFDLAHGWVMAFDKNSLWPSGVFLDTPNGYLGGIWHSGSGLAVDSANNLYLATGNGLFDVNVGGIDYGDSILRLSLSGNQIVVQDYFTPWDQGWLSSHDWDLGSGGAMLLPDQPGAPYPHLLVQAGKEGTIDLVNRDNMGHFNAGGDTQIVQTLRRILAGFGFSGFWGAPTMWNNNLYFGGVGARLKAFRYDPQAQQIQAQFTSATPEYFEYPGPTPSVSSNGTSNGIVWIFGSDSVLRAYDANNLATEFYNSNQNPQRDQAGTALQFNVPTVADGMVFLGARNEVDVYGLLN
jgi:hypothetical protein